MLLVYTLFTTLSMSIILAEEKKCKIVCFISIMHYYRLTLCSQLFTLRYSNGLTTGRLHLARQPTHKPSQQVTNTVTQCSKNVKYHLHTRLWWLDTQVNNLQYAVYMGAIYFRPAVITATAQQDLIGKRCNAKRANNLENL